MTAWHFKRHETTHPRHHSLIHRDTRRPLHEPENLDTADQKYKQDGGHEKKVHEQQAVGECPKASEAAML